MELPRSLFRVVANLYPPFLFTRTKVRSISPDWREMVVELPKSLLSRNYVGTTFGGTLYAAADPWLMIMLIKILGIKDYVVWDKGAVIDFKRPARSKVTYRFVVTDQDLKAIKREVARKGKTVHEFTVHGHDKDGHVCVEVKKLIYIRKKSKSPGATALN